MQESPLTWLPQKIQKCTQMYVLLTSYPPALIFHSGVLSAMTMGDSLFYVLGAGWQSVCRWTMWLEGALDGTQLSKKMTSFITASSVPATWEPSLWYCATYLPVYLLITFSASPPH